MSQDRTERWRELELSLSDLLASMTSQINPASSAIVSEFIENREYGLALEWLVEAASIQKGQLSEAQQTEVHRLADVMEINLGS